MWWTQEHSRHEGQLAKSKFYKHARSRLGESPAWLVFMAAAAASGQRMRPPANGSSSRASAAAAQRMGAARASAGFQPAFCETPAAHSLSVSLSTNDDFFYVASLPARLPGSIILALRGSATYCSHYHCSNTKEETARWIMGGCKHTLLEKHIFIRGR